MESMERLMRLDLIEKGRTVLIKTDYMKRYQPFTVEEFHPGERGFEVGGNMILTNEKVNISGSLTAYKMNDDWINSTIENIEIKIYHLTDVNEILETFKSKKISATIE